MKIQKRVLAQLEGVYALCSTELFGKKCFLAATEQHGKCLLFTPPEWSASEVWSGPGGTMSLVPLPQSINTFLAIQNFFPIFKSEDANIVLARFNDNNQKWDVKRIIDLPFVHRFDALRVGLKRYFVAAALCAAKDYQEDWSKPGAAYVGTIPDNLDDKWTMKPLIQGITKNHGMCSAIFDGRQVVLVTGNEGVFSITPPQTPDRDWAYERLIDQPVGDVFVNDLDEDGKQEIITIEPFHGDGLKVYKQNGKRWEPVFSSAINFGHAIWSGKIFGTNGIVVANRGGAKELEIFTPVNGDISNMSRQRIDEGGGPTQVVVANEPDKTLVLAANNAIGEVALYTLTK